MRAGAFSGAAPMAAAWAVLCSAGVLAVLAGCESDDNAIPLADGSADGTMSEASAPVDGAGGDSRRSSGDAGDAGFASDAPTDARQNGPTDAANDADAGPALPPPPSVAAIRVANWSTDVPPIDFCVAPHGSGAFQGPLLAAAAIALAGTGTGGADDAGSPSIAFPSVSAYVNEPPGQYDVRLVVAGAGSCSVPIPLVADPTQIVAMTASAAVTVAIVGQGSTHKLVSFFDDVALVVGDAGVPSQLALRFIDTVPDLGATTFGTNTLATNFSPIFQGVAFSQASTKAVGDAGARTDSNGYALLSPFSSQAVSAHPVSIPEGGAAQEWAASVSAGAGAALTFVLVGSSTNANVGLLWCYDNSGLNSSSVSLTSYCLIP